jgi:hypothetical protein
MKESPHLVQKYARKLNVYMEFIIKKQNEINEIQTTLSIYF